MYPNAKSLCGWKVCIPQLGYGFREAVLCREQSLQLSKAPEPTVPEAFMLTVLPMDHRGDCLLHCPPWGWQQE